MTHPDNGSNHDTVPNPREGRGEVSTDTPDLAADLSASLKVLARHFEKAKSHADNESAQLSELDCAIGNVIQLVPLLAEDYEAAWQAVAIAREQVAKLEATVNKQVAGVVRNSGLVIPR